MEGSEELETLWWRTCVNVSLLRFKKHEIEIEKIAVELQSRYGAGCRLLGVVLLEIVLRR